MLQTFQAAWFLTVNGQSMSPASALQHNKIVILCVYPFALQHLSPFNASVLFACTIQKSASSRLKMSFRAYWVKTVSHMLSALLCQINVCCSTFLAHWLPRNVPSLWNVATTHWSIRHQCPSSVLVVSLYFDHLTIQCNSVTACMAKPNNLFSTLPCFASQIPIHVEIPSPLPYKPCFSTPT